MQWIKASERHPPNWFNARLRNIEQNVEINAKVISVHRNEVEFDSGVGSIRIATYIDNIEWCDSSQPGWINVVKDQIDYLEAVEGDLVKCEAIGGRNLTSLTFTNGNRYWLRIDKQAKATLG